MTKGHWGFNLKGLQYDFPVMKVMKVTKDSHDAYDSHDTIILLAKIKKAGFELTLQTEPGIDFIDDQQFAEMFCDYLESKEQA